MRLLLIAAVLAFESLAAAAGADHDRDTDDRGVFQVIAKAPAKWRALKNPYDSSPTRSPQAKIFSGSIAPNATATTRSAAVARQSRTRDAVMGGDPRAAPLANHCLH